MLTICNVSYNTVAAAGLPASPTDARGGLHALFSTGAGVYTPEFTLQLHRDYTPAPQC
jgi:hypothetical protein